MHPAERQRRRAAIAVTDGVVEKQERQPRGDQRDQVRDDERAAPVLVGDVGEPPDISEANRGTRRRQDKAELRTPLTTT